MASIDCSELSTLLKQEAMEIGSRPDVQSLDDVLKVMQAVPEFAPLNLNMDNLVMALTEANQGQRKVRSELQKKLYALMRTEPAIRKRIAEIGQALDDNALPPRTDRKPSKPTATVAALRDEVKELMAKLRWSEPAVKERLEKSINKLMDRLALDDILPAVKPSKIHNKAISDLEYTQNQLRKEIIKRREALRPRSLWQRIVDPFQVLRSWRTSWDLSALGRQGWLLALGHPVAGIKSGIAMARAFMSDKYAFDVMKQIETGETAWMYRRGKLDLTEYGPMTQINSHEEAFRSELAHYLPGVRRSERSFTVGLNVLRASVFDSIVQNLTVADENLDANLKVIGHYVNIATGRGDLGKFAGASGAMATALFSPKLLVSRFQFAFMSPIWGGESWRGTWQARRLVAMEYAKTLIGFAVVYGLGRLAGGEGEDDPTKADFGKLRFGNTRVDFLAGLGQVTTFLARSTRSGARAITGDKNFWKSKGETGTSGFADTLARFARTKFSPVLSLATDILQGTNVVGENTKIGTKEGARKVFVENMLLPMSFNDVYESLREQGVPKGLAFSLLAILGIGIQNYEKKKKKGRLW